MLPEARIGHRTSRRVRLKVPSQKGRSDYFARLQQELSREKKLGKVEVNPLTASVLIHECSVDIEAIAEYGESHGLFQLQTEEEEPVPISRRVVEPLGSLSERIRAFSGGTLDLAGVAFLALLFIGGYQIARGEFRAPPWYTAFWYALGVFTKSIVDKHKNPA
jgi:hypothetical protein